MSSNGQRFLGARNEVESSIASARTLRDQWIAARESRLSLSKKEADNLGRALRNKLLSVKWDCEDLEDLMARDEAEARGSIDVNLTRKFVEQCRLEVSAIMSQLDEVDALQPELQTDRIQAISSQTEGVAISKPLSNSQSAISNVLHRATGISKYHRLPNQEGEEVQFDKFQMEASSGAGAVFNNVLYDHYDQMEQNSRKQSQEERRTSMVGSPPHEVFANVERPMANVYVNPSENEMILDMLETEYYNPPVGLSHETRLNYTLRKLYESDRQKLFGAVAFLFSFPILLIFFLVV